MPKRSTQDSVLDLTQSQSQSSGSSGKKKSTEDENINTKEFHRKVSDMVRYILFADRKKTGIKRADMVKNVCKENPRLFNKIFQEACGKINQTFGFDVVAMETEDGKGRGYILVNALDDDVLNSDEFLDWKDDSPQFGLLLVILSIIFMNDGALTDINLWHNLKKLGVLKDRPHKVFGNVDKLINTDFTRTHYLRKEKVNGPDGPIYQYTFGPRSQKEISKRKVLQFVSKIYGIDDISSWKSQYEKVTEEENRNGDAEMIDASQDVGY